MFLQEGEEVLRDVQMNMTEIHTKLCCDVLCERGGAEEGYYRYCRVGWWSAEAVSRWRRKREGRGGTHGSTVILRVKPGECGSRFMVGQARRGYERGGMSVVFVRERGEGRTYGNALPAMMSRSRIVSRDVFEVCPHARLQSDHACLWPDAGFWGCHGFL